MGRRVALASLLLVALGAAGEPSPHIFNEIEPREAFAGIHGRLVEAAVIGDVNEMVRLVRSGADPNALGFQNFTPLMWTLASHNDVGLIKLLELGANPNAPAADYGTPVLLAAFDDVKSLRILLDHGGNPNAVDGCDTALAAAMGDPSDRYAAIVERMEVLLSHGADINLKGECSAIHAISVARFDVVLYMLSKGYNYDLAELAKFTSERWASGVACRNQLRVIDALRNRGIAIPPAREAPECAPPRDSTIEPDDRPPHEHTRRMMLFPPTLFFPGVNGKLALATLVGDTVEMERLAKSGADPNAVATPFGRPISPLTLLLDEMTNLKHTWHFGYAALAKLLYLGANPNGPYAGNGTVFLRATSVADFETFKVLLDHGGDVNVTYACSTPLMDAIHPDDRMRRVQLLLAHGADVNAAPCRNWDAGEAAARAKHFDVLLLLLANGYDVDLNRLAAQVSMTGVPAGTPEYRDKVRVLEELAKRGARLPMPGP